jgi:hypothetical protein
MKQHRPDTLEPGMHCVRTQWIRGFMAFLLAWPARTMMLMVSMCPESGFLGCVAQPGRDALASASRGDFMIVGSSGGEAVETARDHGWLSARAR